MMKEKMREAIKAAIKDYKKDNTIDVIENFSRQLIVCAQMIDELNTFKLNIMNKSPQHGYCITCGNNRTYEAYIGWAALKAEVDNES